MKNQKFTLPKFFWKGALLAACAAAFFSGAGEVKAGSLLSVTEESQILAIEDGSGKYLLKSDGFYCLNEDGTLENTPAVHYFDHFVIDGTVFDGYYYHDESGKFRAGNPYMTYLNIPAGSAGETMEEMAVSFEGFFMVNNLGKLTAAPQIRYMNELKLNNQSFNGYYYFDEYGELVTEAGIHELDMTSNGQHFEGMYYFGGENGLLVQEEQTTPEGFSVDETGRLKDGDKLGMETLEPKLTEMLESYQGEWSAYVKNLDSGEEILINNQPMYSASLIKAFVLADSYKEMENVKANEGQKLKKDADSPEVKVKVDDLIQNMITVSDNESFNELVRLQSEKNDFKEGAEKINEYLKGEGYKDTSVQHTLAPSASPSTGLGGRNTTSVKDCGMLLERIYEGECVSEEASEEMLNILLQQEVDWKIPSGLSDDVKVANKTGETDTSQHDIAIVYGEKTTYIFCVMSQDCPEGTAIHNIRDLSGMVYYHLNL
ncbi:MAG: serine hydrolase [Clostridiales bacterium]|nr:serine hydrolase [Clostridiales bacterium]